MLQDKWSYYTIKVRNVIKHDENHKNIIKQDETLVNIGGAI